MAKKTPAAAQSAAALLAAGEQADVRVELLVSLAGERFSYGPGQLIDTDAATAERWIATGVARPHTEREREVQRYVAEVAAEQEVAPAAESPAGEQAPVGDQDPDSGEIEPD